MSDGPVVIQLELTVSGDSLTGWARDATGTGRAFEGRLGLLAAIDALLVGSTSEAARETL